jgi:urease accessory protein
VNHPSPSPSRPASSISRRDFNDLGREGAPSGPTALLLLLLDSRAPTGGHNHSAGMEAAVTAGRVRDLADVESFCRARLATAGKVAAAFAATACDSWPGTERGWADLDAEFDARTPSEAVRAASRQLGSGLRRFVRSMLATFDPPWAGLVPAPHHPLVLGAAVAAAGGSGELAARAAALNAVSAPASAAVRLLGLDPFAVQATLAHLAIEIDTAHDPAPYDDRHTVPAGGGLPADGSPALDLLADYHLTTEVRLFAS